MHGRAKIKARRVCPKKMTVGLKLSQFDSKDQVPLFAGICRGAACQLVCNIRRRLYAERNSPDSLAADFFKVLSPEFLRLSRPAMSFARLHLLLPEIDKCPWGENSRSRPSHRKVTNVAGDRKVRLGGFSTLQETVVRLVTRRIHNSNRVNGDRGLSDVLEMLVNPAAVERKLVAPKDVFVFGEDGFRNVPLKQSAKSSGNRGGWNASRLQCRRQQRLCR